MGTLERLEDFWTWKRSDILMKFCEGKWDYEEFIVIWDSYKNRKDDVPQMSTGDLTDYYYWKTSNISKMPSSYFVGPSESCFKNYYDNVIAPKRKKRVQSEGSINEINPLSLNP